MVRAVISWGKIGVRRQAGIHRHDKDCPKPHFRCGSNASFSGKYINGIIAQHYSSGLYRFAPDSTVVERYPTRLCGCAIVLWNLLGSL